jgi:hypothetical protein
MPKFRLPPSPEQPGEDRQRKDEQRHQLQGRLEQARLKGALEQRRTGEQVSAWLGGHVLRYQLDKTTTC